MDPKETREQLVRDAKSSLILDAAQRVFAEKGYHETRLEDIAIQAGFSKAALYNYYSDKESIFLNLVNRDFDRLIEVMEKTLVLEAPFMDSIAKAMRAVLSFFGDHFSIMLATSHFRSVEKCTTEKNYNYHEKLFCQYKKNFTQVIEIFIKNLKQAKRKGEVRSELDERIVSGYIISLLRGVLTEWRMQGKKGDADAEISSILTFLRKGLDFHPAH